MNRFSTLEDVYNELVAADFDFSTLPATSKYRKYYLWKTDPTVRAIGEDAMPEQGAKKLIGVRPFGLPYVDTNRFKTSMSGRAHTDIAAASETAGALEAVYGVVDAGDGYIRRAGFVPAKAILAKKLETSVAVRATDNRITGRAYKKRTGVTYTIPFGRIAATSTEFDRQELILTTAGADWGLTFKPEKLRRR